MMLRLLCTLLLLAATVRGAPLEVVTSIPDLADFVRRVGGEHVRVSALASGKEDPHNVLLRPSMITRLARADLFVVMGLELEHAYAPALLAEARNPRLRPGSPGYLDCSLGITPLDIPKRIDRSEGDQHPHGSPHYNTDPLRMKRAAEAIGERLARLDPAHAALYQANTRALGAELEARTAQWKRRLAGKRVRFVSYHPVWAYFAERFGVEQVATIQPKPGVEPGPRAVAALITQMQEQKVPLIVKESYFSDRLPRRIATATGARLVTVPTQVHATPAATDYFTFMDAVVNAFAGEGATP